MVDNLGKVGNIINNNNINNFFIQNASVIEMLHDKLDNSIKP